MTKLLLIIFAKNPELGKVKTRLSATVGNQKALAIYHTLLSHTCKITQPLNCEKAVFYSGYIDNEDIWDNTIYQKHTQEGDDLGIRMFNAFQKGFDMGYEKVSIIGTDNLEITAEIIMRSFDVLEVKDIAVGPAKDGGYYLLSMKKNHDSFFKNKQWSTSSVFENTLSDIKALHLSYEVLPALHDIDTEEDWNKRLSK